MAAVAYGNQRGSVITAGFLNRARFGFMINAKVLNARSRCREKNHDGQSFSFQVHKSQRRRAPPLTRAPIGTGTITIRGTLTNTPNTILTVEFFASPTRDPSGFGEGQTFLGNTQVRMSAFHAANINKGYRLTCQAVRRPHPVLPVRLAVHQNFPTL
jgi:hypothetical protein